MEPFIGITDLEAFLDGVTLDPGDLLIAIALDSACTSVRTYLDQQVNYLADDEVILDGTGRKRLRLPERPVRDVATVELDGEEVTDDLYFRRRSTLIRSDGLDWTTGDGNIAVTYSHGWNIEETSDEDLPVPADIRLAALCIARRIIDQAGEDAGTISSESIGGYSYTLSTVAEPVELTKPEKAVLSRYKLRTVP